MIKIILKILAFCFSVYILIIGLAYFNQESLLFHPTKTSKNQVYETQVSSREITFQMPDSTLLNGLYFQQEDNSKGLIFYLHGNAGSLKTWKDIAESYFQYGYDVFIYDYRGFGKSQGALKHEGNLLDDAQHVFIEMQAKYQTPITLIGYSLGSGIAIDLASKLKIKQLFLLAPYYSMEYLALSKYPFLPSFILKYPLRSDLKFTKIKCPTYMFHGVNDGLIPILNSEKLYSLRPNNTSRFILENIGHNGLDSHPTYRKVIDSLFLL
jgi:uncharacterized protein